MIDLCLICNQKGKIRRKIAPSTLLKWYNTKYSIVFEEQYLQKYFNHQVYREFQCEKCRFRWYSPSMCGGGDYYDFLQKAWSDYYKESWEYSLALDWLKADGIDNVLEVGCGNGDFLLKASNAGIDCLGVEISTSALEKAKIKGLNVFTPETIRTFYPPKAICMFQVLEHFQDPVKELGFWIDRYNPKSLLLATPCIESAVSWSDRPLYWPPHHISNWSLQAYKHLAKKLGYHLEKWAYEPGLNFQRIYSSYKYITQNIEFHSSELPYLSSMGRIALLQYFVALRLKRAWTRAGHTLLVKLCKS